jgi:NAD(P)-dependent dehydrogenase (short-subunit alcohol dehydrogenase family)
VTDVSDENQVETAMRAAREAFGSLDIVVNCPGVGATVQQRPASTCSPAVARWSWDRAASVWSASRQVWWKHR